MNTLPRADEAVILIEKFTKYALNPTKDEDKAYAFQRALGFNKDNVPLLIAQIKANLSKFPAVRRGDIGFGMRYEVAMEIVGANGNVALVKTGWIDDAMSGEMRLTSAYVHKFRTSGQ